MIVQLLICRDILSDLRKQDKVVESLYHLAIQIRAENFGGFEASLRTPLLRLGEP
jgi:hypothetical protein